MAQSINCGPGGPPSTAAPTPSCTQMTRLCCTVAESFVLRRTNARTQQQLWTLEARAHYTRTTRTHIHMHDACTQARHHDTTKTSARLHTQALHRAGLRPPVRAIPQLDLEVQCTGAVIWRLRRRQRSQPLRLERERPRDLPRRDPVDAAHDDQQGHCHGAVACTHTHAHTHTHNDGEHVIQVDFIHKSCVTKRRPNHGPIDKPSQRPSTPRPAQNASINAAGIAIP